MNLKRFDLSKIPSEIHDAALLLGRYAMEHGWEDWEYYGIADGDLVWKLRRRIQELQQVIETNAEIASGKKTEYPEWKDVTP